MHKCNHVIECFLTECHYTCFCISAFIYISNMHPVITKKCSHLRLLENKPTTTTTTTKQQTDFLALMTIND